MEYRDSARVRELLAQPVALPGHDFFLDVSMGVALHPAHGRDPEALLRAANAAMHEAKHTPGTSLQFAEERFERVLKVLDLPDTPPFVARGGGYFDLGYLLRIDGTGEWVGHVGSKTRYIPLGPESLAYVMEQAGLESLPPAPDADPEDVKAAHKIDPRAYMLLPLPLLLILVAARLLRPKPKIKIALPPSAAETSSKGGDWMKKAQASVNAAAPPLELPDAEPATLAAAAAALARLALRPQRPEPLARAAAAAGHPPAPPATAARAS